MALTKTPHEIVNEDLSGLLGIAPHWKRVRLGDVGSVINGFPFESAQFSTTTGVPLARIRDVIGGATATRFNGDFDPSYLIENGDLLVGMDGDFNAARWKGPRALLNQRVCKIEVHDSLFVPALLDHLLPVYLRAINAQTSSVTVKHLSSRTIEDIPLPLPPFAEQTRLSDRLDELLSGLQTAEDDLRRARRKLTLYRQSLLKSAVDGSLTAGWRRGRAAGEWTRLTVADLAEVGTGVTPLRSNARYFTGGTVPWVTSGALNSPTVERASEYVTEAALNECRLKVFPAGSLLIALYGEGKTRGMCSELKIAATVNQAVASVVLRPAFTEYRPYLKAFFWHSYDNMRKQAAGGVQPNLNLSIIKGLQVPVPPPDEQREIIARLDELLAAAVSQREALDRSLAMAAVQRQNIFRAAFSGRLVPQDPNDEPASVLLDRIRAQQEARAAKLTRPKSRQAKLKKAAC